MVSRRRPLVLSLLILFALLPFQNCGQEMSSAKSNGNSLQCRAQFKAEAVAARHSQFFNCSEFNNYQCERRLFSPDVENMSHSLKECIGTGEICVDVDVRQFSTAAARTFEPAEAFLPGGAYNREEFRCHHRYIYEGYAVFEGSGDSLEEALAAAMRSCEEAVEAR